MNTDRGIELAATRGRLEERPASYTFDHLAYQDYGYTLYYFRLGDRSPPPYLTQLHVSAILDVAADGTLAGVEIVDQCPPPPQAATSDTVNYDELLTRQSGLAATRMKEEKMHEFEPFQKIPRLKRDCVITEKIDGTNAVVFIDDDGHMFAGSRTRWITPDDDNFGFARWVDQNAEELSKLGPGRHFGEWWGSGIQRRYGLTEKRFSLFNVGRWTPETIPACVSLVPTLYSGPFSTDIVDAMVEKLRAEGSVAAPGFMKAEGVIVYLPAARELFKVTLEKDSEPKGIAPAEGG